MAYLMVVQCSGRRNGFTASLMKEVVSHLSDIDNLEIEVYHLHDYRFGPCTSCFHCIRNIGSGCILDDDWGKSGNGVLYQAFKRANGLLMVDPVHGWGMSAAACVFAERIYPTSWDGTPYGMPFASISCASNQGFQYRATEEYCKTAATKGMRYIGGLPVHLAYFDEGRRKACELGSKLADAAMLDERNGRKKLTDEEIFLMYNGTTWDIVDGYIQNLTNNSFRYDDSVPVKALSDGTFDNPEAIPLLEKTCEHLKSAIDHYNADDREAAARELALTSKFWTNATYKQFCENFVKSEIPETYRSLDKK